MTTTISNNDTEIHDQAKEYYGKTLKGTNTLKTSCCTCSEIPPKHISEVISLLHDEVVSHYYGCGLVIPSALENLTCLDLGSGAGRDVYILSKLVGEKGKVIGIDMTQEQLDIAEKYKEYHSKKFGYSQSNVQFIKGYIEDLKDIQSESVDLIISNCVVNLSPDKKAVLSEAYRVLKFGGEMYFSDVYSDRRIPEKLLKDPVLHGECLSGALYWNDFFSIAKNVGFVKPLLVKDRKLTIDNKEIEDKIGFALFYSATFRLFKIKDCDDDFEDYGQYVKYLGGINTENECFILDYYYKFEKNKNTPVSGNVFRILRDSRFMKYFEFFGDFNTHYGNFNRMMIPFMSAYQNYCCCGQYEQSNECCGVKNEKCCCSSSDK